MKIAILFASLGTVYPSANDENLQSLGQLYKAHGAIANFVYERLTARPTVRKLGRSKSATAQTQERLTARLLELQERQEHIVKRCGPGGSKAIAQERKKEVDSLDGGDLIASRGKFENFDLLRPGHSSFLPDIKSQEISALDFEEPADDFIPSGQPSAGGLIDTPFFDRLGGRGPSFGSAGFGPGFGPAANGFQGLQGFDPLNSMDYETSVRKRRDTVDLEDIRATRKDMQKKIKELEKVFVELEDFVANNLSDCSTKRIKLHQYKLDKVKGRFQKVIERQGTAEIQRGRRRMRKTTKSRNNN
ncbi:Oidioi.mRNA.OKI2018_I69.chr1.g2664.t1.cds [Oikopleura dioica]|uniref:Oidioi.mRNA.OKI2018_I69.chr1.g2664.t1.cds n=1 Tax=Oikopleura dioica TaxID=34765 RepID=A0ABN7T0Y4_OIKDI|nr:Oidioi.mRNA.OKI2018_I69.chr1.g2664.t1.cds [Oikopleura dioica]